MDRDATKRLNKILDFIEFLFENIETHTRHIDTYGQMQSLYQEREKQRNRGFEGRKEIDKINAEYSTLWDIILKDIKAPIKAFWGISVEKWSATWDLQLCNLMTIYKVDVEDSSSEELKLRVENIIPKYIEYQSKTKSFILMRILGESNLSEIECITNGSTSDVSGGLKYLFDYYVPNNEFIPLSIKPTDYQQIATFLNSYIYDITPEIVESIWIKNQLPENTIKPLWKKKSEGMLLFYWINESRANKITLKEFNEWFGCTAGTEFKQNDLNTGTEKAGRFMTEMNKFPKF